MLIIEPAADGRLHLRNSQRSGYARDVGSARSLATDWGHTEISIRSALARMGAAGSEAQGAWKVRAERDNRSAGPRRSTPTAPEPVDPKPLRHPRTRAAKLASIPAAEGKPVRPEAERPAKSKRQAASRERATARAASKTAVPARKKSGAVAPPSRAPKKESAGAPRKRKVAAPAAPGAGKKARSAKPAPPPRSPGTPRSERAEAPSARRAARLFREGVREIAAIEAATIPFAREPWTKLRELAEQIASSLEGKSPRRG